MNKPDIKKSISILGGIINFTLIDKFCAAIPKLLLVILVPTVRRFHRSRMYTLFCLSVYQNRTFNTTSRPVCRSAWPALSRVAIENSVSGLLYIQLSAASEGNRRLNN